MMRRNLTLIKAVISVTIILAGVLSRLNVCLSQESLVLGVHPYLSASELHKRFSPLAEYLSEAIGLPVTIEISPDYQTHIDRVGRNEFDIAFMGPASYVRLVETYGRRPILAGLEVNGRTTFHGVIVTRVGSGLHDISGLRGRSFAFGDPNSTMSHLVPRYMLVAAGVDLEDMKDYAYLNSHDNVALAVLMGDFDAGAIKEEIYEKYKARGLRLVARTPELSEHLFVASSTLPEPLVGAIRRAMQGMGGDERAVAILTSIKDDVTALVQVHDDDYDALREILRALRQAGVEP